MKCGMVQTILWPLTTILLSAADQHAKDPELPLALIAKTVAWQAHWDQRAGIATKAPGTLTFKINKNSEVWVDELKWIISFDDRNGEWFPFYVEHAPESVKRDAFTRLPKAIAKLPIYTNHFHPISTIQADKRSKLLDAFNHEASSESDVAFYKSQTGQPVEK